MDTTFEILGDWVIRDGERGVPPTVRCVAALGAGQLLPTMRKHGQHARQWSACWESAAGAALTLEVSELGTTDAQRYDYALHLPDGTRVTFLIVDACSMDRVAFAVVPGTLPAERVEAALRAAFTDF